MHPTKDHAWSITHITTIRLANMDSDILFKVSHTSGENGFPLNVGERLSLPDGRAFEVVRRELRYVQSSAGAGTFKTTAYLDVYVKPAHMS